MLGSVSGPSIFLKYAPRVRKVHYAWYMAGLTFLTLLSSAAFRSTTSIFLEPFESEFGWGRDLTSSAVAVNLFVYGLTAPFAANLMERYSLRRVVSSALLLVALGTGLTTIMTQGWQLILLWGFFVGFGTGCLALVLGSAVANRWFDKNRGFVTGIFSAAYATGGLVFLPLFGYLLETANWRVISYLIAGLATIISPLIWWKFKDSPHSIGINPFGSTATELTTPPPLVRASAIGILREVWKTKPFIVLAGTFFICGWSTNGLIGAHFIPAAHDHGMPVNTAASLLALVGVFDLIGTLASGWLTDRVSPIILLFFYYGLRGLALFTVPVFLGPHVTPPLLFFVVFYGLDWVATVPPTISLTRKYFGYHKAGVVYGWVFASHMIGASIAAFYAGLIRTASGAYTIAWITAAVLCILASLATLTLRKMSAVEVD